MSKIENEEGGAAGPEWMPAIAARQLVAERNGPAAPIATAIASRAHVGLLRAKAELFRFEVRGEYGRKQWKELRDSEIPPEFWWAKGHAALEQNWQVGDFSTWIDNTYQMQAFGVKFDRQGIEAMLAPLAVNAPQPSEADKVPEETTLESKIAGKGRNLTHNHPFAAAMVALKLANIKPEQRSRLNAESVGQEMDKFYRESHDERTAPHPDNLKNFGKGVLDALKRHWEI